MPQYTWLATGGITGLKLKDLNTISILEGRKIIMFPDFGMPDNNGKTPYDKWCDIASFIRSNVDCKITVSNILEETLDPKNRVVDMDIADVLIKTDASGYAIDNGQRLTEKIKLSHLR